MTDGVMVAAVSGSASSEVIRGSRMVTAPEAESHTSFHIPMFLPRIVDIQSHPMVAWNVGLSYPRRPPLKSVSLRYFSFTAPGWAFLIILTASTLRPSRSSGVMSECPRMNAPSILAACLPLMNTSAFQFMPSRLSITRLPFMCCGRSNSVRYQKSELKNDSEICIRLSA